ncbi:MAG: GspH/FimT family pseudopilin [Acidobacteriia bacterium]|nr:GspH/FimT family pseudopilin [Terriglobia bacterium]
MNWERYRWGWVRKSPGLSLVETMTVLAISLALASVAVPKIIQTVQRQRLSATSRNLAVTLQAARFVAILRQGIYGVQINNNNHTFEVVQWNGSAWQTMTVAGPNNSTAYDAYSNRKTFNSNVTITTSGVGSDNVIAFNGKGEVLDSTQATPTAFTSGSTLPTITFSTAAGSRDLLLTRFGNIRILKHGSTVQM